MDSRGEQSLDDRRRAIESTLDRLSARQAASPDPTGTHAAAVGAASRDRGLIALQLGRTDRAQRHFVAAVEHYLQAADRRHAPPVSDARAPDPVAQDSSTPPPPITHLLGNALWLACIVGRQAFVRPVAFEVLSASPPDHTPDSGGPDDSAGVAPVSWPVVRYAAGVASRDATAAATVRSQGRGRLTVAGLRRAAYDATDRSPESLPTEFDRPGRPHSTTDVTPGRASAVEGPLLAGLDAVASKDGPAAVAAVRELAARYRVADLSRTPSVAAPGVCPLASALVGISHLSGLPSTVGAPTAVSPLTAAD